MNRSPRCTISSPVLCRRSYNIITPTSSLGSIRRNTALALHTLHHGSVKIDFDDLRCNVCCRFTAYDGLHDRLFSVNKQHLFTRELLDVLMWDVCRFSGTFGIPFHDKHLKHVQLQRNITDSVMDMLLIAKEETSLSRLSL